MANIVDYQHLAQAKANSEQKFDDMIQNLVSMRGQIVKMSGDSWKGQSSNVFNEVFDEIKKKITSEREQFSNAMDQRLTPWYNEFDETEKERVKAFHDM